MKKQNKSIYLLILIPIVFIFFCISLYSDYTHNSLDVESRTIDIKQGMKSTEIAMLLKQSHVIKYGWFFEFTAKISGDSKKYKSGDIKITKGMSYSQIQKLLANSNRVSDNKVTIPEGFEFRQIAKRLADKGFVNEQKFYDEAKAKNFNYEFLQGIPQRENQLEGYLFPDTYFIEKNMTEHDIINMMLKRFDEVFKIEYYARCGELNMSVDKIVNLASIIERETEFSDERPLVAGVFYNRLTSKTMPYLQSCATVEYILKKRKPILSNADTKIDSPYNTYKYKGLPIGPIASPSEEAIKSALYPKKSDYLFFVMGKDKKHIFSKTYEEHLKATKKARTN